MSCRRHPYYKGLKEPVLACKACWKFFYNRRVHREDVECSLCRAKYFDQEESPWALVGPGIRICHRCQTAGRDARRYYEWDKRHQEPPKPRPKREHTCLLPDGSKSNRFCDACDYGE